MTQLMGRRTLLWAAVILVIAVGLVLGRNYQLDSAAAAFKVGKGSTAIGKLKPLAALGDRKAQVLLGYAYAYGWAGVPQNDEQAMGWFSHSAVFGSGGPTTQGNPGAAEALSVAEAYATGSEGVPPDGQKSKKWMQLAARAGSKEAASELSKGQ
jgi:TPR repeat protein